MRIAKSFLPALLLATSFSSLSYALVPDRIAGTIDSSQKVPLYGNVQGLARPESDLGRADGSRAIDGLSLNFRLSAAQQKDLDQFLAELGHRSSPNYHKYLTIPQYARRFGMSQNDLNKVVAWVQSQGFTNIKVANNRNKISFDGTVAQIESTFALEMHNYLVDGVVHLANAMNPSVPAALSAAVMYLGHLNNFAPKPRLKVKSNLTSYVSGNHFLTPADFATIYDLNALYSAGATGSNQKIAIVGQSTVSTADLANFRTAAGLPASTVTMKLIEGTATRCSGDEGESDLDLEWSGGVAKNASITFIFAGLDPNAVPPDTCAGSRFFNVWDALEDALTGTTTGAAGSPVAPFVSTSYGFCEQGMQAQSPGFAHAIQGWVQTGQTLGVTLVAASGDSGAADCDPSNSTSATQGFAVDVPAAIPETTGAGGNEFSADSPTYTTPNPPGGNPPYWAAAGATTDTLSSALEYIPETAWNDTTFNLANGGGLGASGGGASVWPLTYGFAKPTWQTGTGVPADGKRDVPDISITASPDHDGYLLCSEDFQFGQCTAGFRDGAGGSFGLVGGTSAAAPTFTAILALVNQYLGNAPPTGLAPVNPMLYSLYPNNATSKVFHDVTTGNNIVPCTAPSTNCPAGTTQFGFNASVGYDQVTGLGSVDGFNLAQAWAATLGSFSATATALSPASISAGNSVTSTVTITPQGSFNKSVTLSCSGLPSGAGPCTFNPASVAGGNGTSQLTVPTSPTTAAGTTSVTVTGTSGSLSKTTSVSLTVTATTQTFSLTSSLGTGTLQVSQGATSSPVNLTVTSLTGFIVNSLTTVPVTYTCSGLPSESTCTFNPGGASSISTTATSVTLTIKTTAPTTALHRSDRSMRIFYAALLPGLLGIMFVGGSRKRSLRGLRLLGLIAVLGFSTLWLASCGGGSGGGTKDPGTPKGPATVNVNAVATGAASITASPVLQVNLVVN
jgi:subtilase family serine protease